MGVRRMYKKHGDVMRAMEMYKKHRDVEKNILNISMIVQRSAIPPLRGARGM